MFDPIEKIRAKEFLEKKGWKSLMEIAERKKELQERIDKACKESTHAKTLSENED
jgi:hypothetical protein